MLAIPLVLVAVRIDQLYPGGFRTFAWKAFTTFLRGLHL